MDEVYFEEYYWINKLILDSNSRRVFVKCNLSPHSHLRGAAGALPGFLPLHMAERPSARRGRHGDIADYKLYGKIIAVKAPAGAVRTPIDAGG
jgi:hypothetical protein